MSQSLALRTDKWLQVLGALLLGTAVVVAVAAQNIIAAAIPFAILFALLVVLNWRAAWWVLLPLVPLSIQIDELAGGTLSTSLPDEPAMALFMGVMILLFAARRKVMPESFWRHPLTLVMVLQFFWLVVSVIYSQEVFISVKYLLAKSWILSSFFLMPVLLFREKADFRRAIILITVPTLLTTIFIFIRHWKLYHFGFREIEKAIAGIYFNHVDYSTVLSMIIPALIAAYPRTKSWRWWWRLVLAGTIIFLIIATYLTYARAAMLALVFAAVVVVAMRKKLVHWIMPVFYGLIALGLVALVSKNKYLDFYPDYEHTYSHFTFYDHMIATFKGQDMSSAERLYRWVAAVRMSNAHPVTGVGPNAFYDYYKPYAVTSFRTYVSRNPERSTTHNYFLFMLVEQGWPAMLLYAILIAVYFVQAQKTYHRFKDRFWRAATLGITGAFAAGFINNFFSELIDTHKVGALFYLSIALMIVLRAKSRQATSSGLSTQAP
jgi:O-antigen ligase